ncbi:putative nucleotide diphosphatase [Helianthus annuus]|nr:putative nucleotide diphosphatase [Helianthus annuus]
MYILICGGSSFWAGLNNMLMAYEDKSAYALCIFSLAVGPDYEPLTFVGKTPIRYAEMPKEEKNKISHGSRALALVKSHFAEAGYVSIGVSHFGFIFYI